MKKRKRVYTSPTGRRWSPDHSQYTEPWTHAKIAWRASRFVQRRCLSDVTWPHETQMARCRTSIGTLKFHCVMSWDGTSCIHLLRLVTAPRVDLTEYTGKLRGGHILNHSLMKIEICRKVERWQQTKMFYFLETSVYMYNRLHSYWYACVRERLRVCVHAYARTSMCVRACVFACVRACVRVCVPNSSSSHLVRLI